MKRVGSRGILLWLIFLSVCTLAMAVLMTSVRAPDFRALRSSVEVVVKNKEARKTTRKVGPKEKGWVRLGQISNPLIMAVISSEDTSFYQHKGIDFHELREAIKKDLEEKRWARGASTITQQVVKNVFLTQEKTLWRKFREIIWAWRIEKVLSKSEILCFYLNVVEWGPGIYGIRQAARHYFSKSPAEITAKEAAFLVMVLPSPIKYHSYFLRKELTAWASQRVSHILRVMNRMGFIGTEAYRAALAESLWGEIPQIDDTDQALPEEEPQQDFFEGHYGIDSIQSPPIGVEDKTPVIEPRRSSEDEQETPLPEQITVP